MLKEEDKMNNPFKKKTSRCKINTFFNKYPYMIIILAAILILLLKIYGDYFHSYFRELLPFSYSKFKGIIDWMLSIPIIVITAHYIKKYFATSRNKLITEEKYDSVINNIKEVVFQTDKNGLWTFLNPAWTEVTGFGVEECLGTSFIDFVYPEDREKNRALFQPLIEGKKDYCRHEIRYINKETEFCWVEVFARLILDDKGNIIGTAGTLMDVTIRKEMEYQLRDRERILKGVSKATAILLRTMELDDGLNQVLQVLGKATKADRSYIFQNHVHPISKKLIVSHKYEWCNQDIEPQADNPDLQEICYYSLGIMRWYDTLSSGKEVKGFVRDFPDGERLMLEPQGVKTLAIVPIFVDNSFWGFLGFDDCTHNREWTNSEVALLNTAAASIGGAIKRSQDEKQIQILLKNDFKQTVQNLQNLVFKCRRTPENEFYFTLFEGRLADKLGLTTERVYERKLISVLKDKTNKVKHHFVSAFEGNICNFELEYDDKIYYTSLSPIYHNNEVVEIVGSATDITNLKAAEEKVRYMAYYDTLTGLPNRAFFREQLGYLISHANRNNTSIAILFLDLDRFKVINDTLDHMAGDELLKETANRLKRVVNDDDMVVRMGGDEFIVVFPEVEEGNITRLVQKIIEVFKDAFNIKEHEIFASTSIGISLFPDDGRDMDSLIKNAETAMYRAKDNGRNNYQFYTEDMNRKALERLGMENSLRRALEKNELFMVYQPRISLETGKIIGAEALLRWKHTKLGLISPGEFIPIAEEIGTIHSIGKWALETVCKQAKKWNDLLQAELKVSVNISAIQFQKDDLVEIIKNALEAAQLKPNLLELEITENTIMQKTERTLKIIKELKAIGVEISIDDFGTGFSSLSYIKEFDSDNLKIDKSFIDDIGSGSSNESIIGAIISMAHSMKMTVVAEGVETNQQLEFLRSIDCDEVQGYFFSKPILPSEFMSLLATEL
ncbi:EAL domain-containing protein [Alkaliphilus serpentinus]|nr:EAL domain-containing protein [Alkaliphilus serpentinus]